MSQIGVYAPQSSLSKDVELTVGQAYDEEIRRCKQSLEATVIAKAKAETLGMLDYPVHELRKVLGHVI